MNKINLTGLKKAFELEEKAKKDKLLAFVANGEKPSTEIREDNLKILFSIARSYGVRYLYVGRGEIAGCEDVRDGGTWPAMWSIAKKAGFQGSCGNSDQYQCVGSEYAFPVDSYGGWDLSTNIKLSDEVTDGMYFKRVVTRYHKTAEYNL